jgi:hypothetical protein
MERKKKKNLTIWGTPKTPRTIHFANKVTPEFDETIRDHAKKAKCMITEMLDKYQTAYVEKLEHKKIDKKLNKDLREKGEINCPYCSQIIHSI